MTALTQTRPTAKTSAPGTPTQPTATKLPFSKGTVGHDEQFFDQTFTMGASTQQLSPIDIPAIGFFRAIVLDFTVTAAGNSATVAMKPDAPFSLIEDVQLTDVSSNPFFGSMTGYHAYLAHKYGGYRGQLDPKTYPDYVAPVTGTGATGGSFRYQLRLPVEIIARSAFGCLYNGNSATPYRLKLTLAAAASVYSTSPTALPTVRIKASLEAWFPPNPADAFQRPQNEQPPAIGTTQFWTQLISAQLATGATTFNIRKVGLSVRKVIFEFRDASNVRQQSLVPNDAQLYMDTRPLWQQATLLLKMNAHEAFNFYSPTLDAAQGPDTGVLVWDLAHDFSGSDGFETTDQYLLTSMATRLDFQFTSLGTTALNILVNDVSPANGVIL